MEGGEGEGFSFLVECGDIWLKFNSIFQCAEFCPKIKWSILWLDFGQFLEWRLNLWTSDLKAFLSFFGRQIQMKVEKVTRKMYYIFITFV